MLSILEGQAPGGKRSPQQRAKAIAALCVGGMVLARSLNDKNLGDEIREAAMQLALEEGDWEPN